MNNPYLKCPEYETTHFVIRLISEDDAEGLLKCYSDENARLIFNSDNCTGDFHINTPHEMLDTVMAWLGCYERQEFIRFTIVDKKNKFAVGTVEMFGMVGEYKVDMGILRVDISSEYEEEEYLSEIFGLCIGEFFDVFGVKKIVTKAIPIAESRIGALMGLGFTPYDFPDRKHYFGIDKDIFSNT